MFGTKLTWIEKLFEEYLINHIPPEDDELALKFTLWEAMLNDAWDSAIHAFNGTKKIFAY